MKVTDATNSHAGFNDDSNGTNDTQDDYTYDEFGNLTLDQNKHITSILYNYLNLPRDIMMTGGKSIHYIYDATGAKMAKQVTTTTATTVTDYLDGFQYVNGDLAFFPHAEGYVNVIKDGTKTFYDYAYNYTDHQGNIRVTWGIDRNTHQLKILQENNYYPFGMLHGSYNPEIKDFEKGEDGQEFPVIDLTEKVAYQYKYNGKEWQGEAGLNWLDYGARNYDPAIGTWLNTDPLAEQSRRFSPYVYASDNPVYFIDPDGMRIRASGFNENASEGSGVSECTDPLVDQMGDWHDKDGNPPKKGITKTALEATPVLGPMITSSDKFDKGDYWGSAVDFGWAVLDVFTLGSAYEERAASQAITKAGEEIVTQKVPATRTSSWLPAEGGDKVINGVTYKTHALERMQPVGTILKGEEMVSRGVPTSAVENALKYGKISPGNTSKEVVRTFENVKIVTNPEGTKVITVIKTGH